MNLFQALEWLSKNPGKELVGVQAPYQASFKARMLYGDLQYCGNESEAWNEWTPNWASAAKYSFTIPERKLPELPEGCKWVKDSKGELYIPHLCAYYYSACSEDVYKIHKALVEEYETRPK